MAQKDMRGVTFSLNYQDKLLQTRQTHNFFGISNTSQYLTGFVNCNVYGCYYYYYFEIVSTADQTNQ